MSRSEGSLGTLLGFLKELDNRKIFYKLANPRDEAIMAQISVPGEYWEVEFFEDGHVEIETYRSQGMEGKETISRLFEEYSD